MNGLSARDSRPFVGRARRGPQESRSDSHQQADTNAVFAPHELRANRPIKFTDEPVGAPSSDLLNVLCRRQGHVLLLPPSRREGSHSARADMGNVRLLGEADDFRDFRAGDIQ